MSSAASTKLELGQLPWILGISEPFSPLPWLKNQVNMNELTWKTQFLRSVHGLESCGMVEEQTCQMARMIQPVLSVFKPKRNLTRLKTIFKMVSPYWIHVGSYFSTLAWSGAEFNRHRKNTTNLSTAAELALCLIAFSVKKDAFLCLPHV